jgi:hypothetical protein
MRRLRPLALAALLAVPAAATDASAQALQSNIGTVSINATKTASLTVAINSGSSQTATIVDNTIVSFSSAVNITTAWDVNPGQTASVTLLGYFTTPAQALANGTNYIPSGWIEGRMTTGSPAAFTAFSGGAVGGIGVAGGSLTLFSEAITGANRTKSRTDDLDLRLNLTGQTTTAGSYTGTLNIRAVTQ